MKKLILVGLLLGSMANAKTNILVLKGNHVVCGRVEYNLSGIKGLMKDFKGQLAKGAYTYEQACDWAREASLEINDTTYRN